MEAVSQAAGAGDIAPFLAYVEKALQTEVGLHSRLQLSEASIQFFMLGAARLLKGFKATAEEEALGIGFLDVVIRPTTESDSRQSYLVELQYLTQAAGTPAAVEAKLDDACRQRTLPPKTSERFQTSKSSPSSSPGRRRMAFDTSENTIFVRILCVVVRNLDAKRGSCLSR